MGGRPVGRSRVGQAKVDIKVLRVFHLMFSCLFV